MPGAPDVRWRRAGAGAGAARREPAAGARGPAASGARGVPGARRRWRAGAAAAAAAAAAAVAAAAAAAAAARGLSRGGADALVLGNYRIKLESSEITQRSDAEEAAPGPGDLETRQSPRSPPANSAPVDSAPRPRPPSQLRSPLCVLFSPRHRAAEGPDRPTRTYIQTLPDTAGSKRIKEIWSDMKKISQDYRL
ncbi:shadow of prion protein-like [Camelus ferus]|uniref:Shadow of prion protein-like n=1 Tax=Camelus ferus TaxID=419612 RepID=A0A8B8S6U5_CAMFR|nr:shadow of prion protein-like [Camelus ferus]